MNLLVLLVLKYWLFTKVVDALETKRHFPLGCQQAKMLSCRYLLAKDQLPHTAFKLLWSLCERTKLPRPATGSNIWKQPKWREKVRNFSSFQFWLFLQALLKSLNQCCTLTTPHLPSVVMWQPVLTKCFQIHSNCFSGASLVPQDFKEDHLLAVTLCHYVLSLAQANELCLEHQKVQFKVLSYFIPSNMSKHTPKIMPLPFQSIQ